jgi:hypothetical protein
MDTQKYDIRDRKYGRSLNEDTLVNGFRSFFHPPSSPNSPSSSSSITQQQQLIITKVKTQAEALRDALSRTECRVYASSLLVAYDASSLSASAGSSDGGDDVKVVVKLIDFAHSHLRQGIGADEGALFGLSNLVRYLDTILLDE